MTRSRYWLSVSTMAGLLALSACTNGSTSSGSGSPVADVSKEPSHAAASTSASATVQLTETYTSALNHYRMSYPSGWTVVAATKAAGIDQRSSTDLFQSPGTEAIAVSSERVPSGMTRAQWIKNYLPEKPALPACFPPPNKWADDPVTVDGRPGGLIGGDFGCSFTRAIVFANGRAYVFNAMPDPNSVNTRIFDQGLFDQFLATVHFIGPS